MTTGAADVFVGTAVTVADVHKVSFYRHFFWRWPSVERIRRRFVFGLNSSYD